VAGQNEGGASAGVAAAARRHRHALHGRLGPLIVVRVRGGAIEVARRPAGVANGYALAVGLGAHLTAGFGYRARRPCRNTTIIGRLDRRRGAAGTERYERHPSRRPPRRLAAARIICRRSRELDVRDALVTPARGVEKLDLELARTGRLEGEGEERILGHVLSRVEGRDGLAQIRHDHLVDVVVVLLDDL